MRKIVCLGALGVATAVLGGHGVGDFAGVLVETLKVHGYSEMIGAIILSLFGAAGCYVMIAMAHVKGKVAIALSNITGAVTQVPFVVLPLTLIMMAIFAQTGVIPYLQPHGSVLAIDFVTVTVLLFGFPTLLIMWKSIQDDGKVNWLETTSMIVLFGLIIYFLARHG